MQPLTPRSTCSGRPWVRRPADCIRFATLGQQNVVTTGFARRGRRLAPPPGSRWSATRMPPTPRMGDRTLRLKRCNLGSASGVLQGVVMRNVSPRTPALDREFDRFVVAESDGLLRSAYLLCGDRGHAEDLVQLALLRALHRWAQIHSSPRAYVSAVLVNLARDRRRNLSRRPRESQEKEIPSDAVSSHESQILERGAILAAARRLPRSQQEVLVCRYVLDLSVSETSVTLRLAEGTVKSYTARALAGLRELLDDDGIADPGGARGASAQR